jgi:hypothetical protein
MGEIPGILAAISNPRIMYYGSHETAFLKRMCERMAVLARARQRRSPLRMRQTSCRSSTLGLISTFSNGLKDIAGYLVPVVGCAGVWAEAIATHRWEAQDYAEMALLDYNRQDWCALQRSWRTGWSICIARRRQ